MKTQTITSSRIVDITGKKFGRLTVIGYLGKVRTHTNWLCQCVCGKKKSVIKTNLRKNKNQFCGKCRKENSMPGVVFTDYKNRAKRKGIEFNLKIERFKILIEGNCFYCGIPSSNIKYRYGEAYKYNGIDRKNNKIGYTIKNSVSCCKLCNVMKMQLTIAEFKNHIKRIFTNGRFRIEKL